MSGGSDRKIVAAGLNFEEFPSRLGGNRTGQTSEAAWPNDQGSEAKLLQKNQNEDHGMSSGAA